MVSARAFIGNSTNGFTFPFNPDSASWTYANNTQSFDTIGGRVVQLLSVSITDMQINGKSGSRNELQRMVEAFRRIMQWQVETQQPVSFRVPSRKWNFRVYISDVPQVGWDVTTVTYPWQMALKVVEDVGLKTHQIQQFELDRLAQNLGYSKSVHGGDPSAFANVVSQTALNSTTPYGGGTGSPGGGSTPSTPPTPSIPGSGSKWQGRTDLWPSKIANASWTGNTIQSEVQNIWTAVFNTSTASTAMCICYRESRFTPTALNHYTSSSGTLHYVYGLFQISDVHSAFPWWPSSGTSGTQGGLMFDPEYNVRSAMTIYSQQGWGPWSTHGSCGV